MSYLRLTRVANKAKSPEISIFELSLIVALKFIVLNVKVKSFILNLISFSSLFTLFSI